ncbi:MAG: MraY family glycosyltransferase [Pseudomonadota bacterium]
MHAVALLVQSLLFALLLILITRDFWVKLGFVDHPNRRKQHLHLATLAGGVSIFFAFLGMSYWLLPHSIAKSQQGFFWAAFLVTLLGAYDDLVSVLPSKRIVLQILIILLLIDYQSLRLPDTSFLNNILASEPLLAIAFIIVAFLIGINTFNLIDGVDGLSSGLFLIAGGFLWITSYWFDLNDNYLTMLILIGSVGGFWLVNFRFPWRKHAQIFLGDAGSTLLGFSLVYFIIQFSNGQISNIPLIYLIWFAAIPILDTLSVMIFRLAEGRSPFRAGKEHIHHCLLARGLTVMQVSCTLYLTAFFISLIGLLCMIFQVSPLLTGCGFAIFIILSVLIVARLRQNWLLPKQILTNEIINQHVSPT